MGEKNNNTTLYYYYYPSPLSILQKIIKNWDIYTNLHFYYIVCNKKEACKNKKGEGTLEPLINFAPTCPDLCRPFKKIRFEKKISLIHNSLRRIATSGTTMPRRASTPTSSNE